MQCPNCDIIFPNNVSNEIVSKNYLKKFRLKLLKINNHIDHCLTSNNFSNSNSFKKIFYNTDTNEMEIPLWLKEKNEKNEVIWKQEKKSLFTQGFCF